MDFRPLSLDAFRQKLMVCKFSVVRFRINEKDAFEQILQLIDEIYPNLDIYPYLLSKGGNKGIDQKSISIMLNNKESLVDAFDSYLDSYAQEYLKLNEYQLNKDIDGSLRKRIIELSEDYIHKRMKSVEKSCEDRISYF